MTKAFTELTKILGSAQLLTGEENCARYNHDGRGGGGTAIAVLRPANTSEISACLQVAHRHGLRVVPQGGRSGLTGAGLADNHVILSLERMIDECTIDPVNRTATVSAGVPLSRINQVAAEYGLTFPIDLGADPSIGGMIATNTGGARFLRYGDVRRNLLAAEVILSDGKGTILPMGSALWKDNSGLDLKQLFISSAGAMGIVTRAAIALHPIAKNSVTAMVALRNTDAALDLLLALEAQFGTLLSTFEGISPAALAACREHMPQLRTPFTGSDPAYVTLVEISSGPVLSSDHLVDSLADLVMPLMKTENGSILDIVIDSSNSLWAVRHAIPECLRASGTVIACDIALSRTDLMRFRAESSAEIAERWPQLQILDFGHVGDGGLHFNLIWPNGAGAIPDGLAESVKAYVFSKVVQQYRGSFSAEHGIGPRNMHYYNHFTPEPVMDLAGKIQQIVAPVKIGRIDFGNQELEKLCPTI